MYLETLKEYDYENEILIWTVVEIIYKNNIKLLTFKPLNIISKNKINDSFVVTYTRKEELFPKTEKIKSYINIEALNTLYTLVKYTESVADSKYGQTKSSEIIFHHN